MRSIVGASLKSRLLIVALAAGLLVVGLIQLPAMPVDVLPEFTPPYVEVQTEALGLSAEEVEQLITVPMEQDLLNGVPWLKTIHSKSVPGLSSILMTFDSGTDLVRARQMVTERLAQAFALPHVSKPPTMLQPLSSTGRVMMIGLSSKDVPLIQMGVLARNCAPLDGHPRRGQCVDLGPARSAAAGASRSETVARSAYFAAASPRNHRQRPMGLVLKLCGSIDARHRRVHRYRPTTARHPASLADHHCGGPGPGARRGHDAAPGRRGQRGGRSSTADWGRDHER